MNKKYREYYRVKFYYNCIDYRIETIKTCCPMVKFHFKKDTTELVISVPKKYCDSLEYELRKAERIDGYCKWYRII